jgi:hypothetical protein
VTDNQEGGPQGPLPQVGLSGPLAGALADLVSLNRDVSFARDCAMTYANNVKAGALSSNDPNAKFLCQAVWSAGAISYRRAFTSGKAHLVKQGSRLKMNDQWKDILDPDMLAAHDTVLEMANQHIAHRVGEHEGVRILGVLSPPPGPRAVVGVGEMLAYMTGHHEVAERLAEVCTILLELIGQEKERLTGILLEQLRGGDIDALYAAATIPGQEPQPPVT